MIDGCLLIFENIEGNIRQMIDVIWVGIGLPQVFHLFLKVSDLFEFTFSVKFYYIFIVLAKNIFRLNNFQV